MKKEILIGFIVGIITNTLGVIVCTFIISQVKDTEFVDGLVSQQAFEKVSREVSADASQGGLET